MDKFLKRDEILAMQDLPFEDVPVPEWGGTVRICSMTSDTALEFSKRRTSTEVKNNYMTDLLSMTIVDVNFKLVFTNKDLEALGKKNAMVIQRLSKIASELNGMGAKAKQDAKKN